MAAWGRLGQIGVGTLGTHTSHPKLLNYISVREDIVLGGAEKFCPENKQFALKITLLSNPNGA